MQLSDLYAKTKACRYRVHYSILKLRLGWNHEFGRGCNSNEYVGVALQFQLHVGQKKLINNPSWRLSAVDLEIPFLQKCLWFCSRPIFGGYDFVKWRYNVERLIHYGGRIIQSDLHVGREFAHPKFQWINFSTNDVSVTVFIYEKKHQKNFLVE